MNDHLELSHVARASECNVQQMRPAHADLHVSIHATTSLKAASMLVLARNRACRDRARNMQKIVQQAPRATPRFVATDSALTGKLAELNGLIARVMRYHAAGGDGMAATRAFGARSIDEALRCLRALAAGVPPTALPPTPDKDRDGEDA